MTNIGSIIGSVHYFSPEQAKGKPVKNNADLYSLGIVLYEMLLGKVPFKGDSPISIALQHINEDIEFSSEEKTRIPQSIRTLIKKLTEKSPEDRYQSSEEVIEDIEYIEQNIDLDFIKQYDDFATTRIPPVEIIDNKTMSGKNNKNKKDKISSKIHEQLDEEKDKKIYDRKPKRNKNKGFKGTFIGLMVLALLGITGIITNGFGLLDNNNDNEIIVPNLVNMSLENANKTINNLDLKLSITDKHDSQVEKNHVISQTPPQGTKLQKGDTVTIVISLGPEDLSAPNLLGFSLSDAKKILEGKGLVLGSVSYSYSEIYKEGIVINQNPVSGVESVKKGDSINVVVSKGPKPVEKPKEEKPSEEQDKNKDENTNEDNTDNGVDKDDTGDNDTNKDDTSDNSTDKDNNEDNSNKDKDDNQDDKESAVDDGNNQEASNLSNDEDDNE